MATGITPGKPCTVNTYLAYEVLGSQSQQTGNNTVVVSNTIQLLPQYYLFIGTKYTTYVGRCLVLNPSGTPTTQRRVVISQANGTGNTKILTVNRDWDTNPAQTTDSLYVCYDMDDLETGGSNTGVALGARTGTYDWTGVLNIGDGTQYAGLYMGAGEGADIYDNGSTNSLIVKNNARLDMGYRNSSGAFVSGGICLYTHNTAGEPMVQFQSGAKGEIIDALHWGMLVSMFLENAAGSAITYRGTKFLSATYGTTFFGSSLYDCSVGGRSGASEYIRFNANSTVDGLILEKTAGITGTNDTSTETITLRDVVFVNNLAFIILNSNKTFYVINPTWTATTYSNFTWTTSTANYVYDQRSIDAVVQQATGTAIANANVLVYENTTLADLVLETYTNGSGVAAGVFTYKKHSTNSSTVTYGGHAIRVDCWLYLPYAAAQTSTSYFNGTVVLIPDAGIVQTVQATALTDGSGITWNKDTNASSIIEYTAGTGTLSVGNTVTQATSGATGVVTKIVDGDSTAGTVHLKSRNGTAFSGTYGLSATAWSATYTASTEQRFAIWIDGNSKSLQTIYDYLAALTAQTTLSATGELIHEWGKQYQVRALYSGASGFYTERSGTLGVFITNAGSGTVQKYTDDAGVTWTPPTSGTLTVTCKNASGFAIEGVRVRIETTGGVLISEGSTIGSGVFTDSYLGIDQAVYVVVRLKGYKATRISGNIASGNLTIPVTLINDRAVDLP